MIQRPSFETSAFETAIYHRSQESPGLVCPHEGTVFFFFLRHARILATARPVARYVCTSAQGHGPPAPQSTCGVRESQEVGVAGVAGVPGV